jgi:sugar lactone lactonase YvrE
MVITAHVADRRRCLLGESPRWDPAGGRVVWIDILGGDIHEMPLDRTGTGEAGRYLNVGGRVGGIVLRAGGRGYVVAQERSINLYDEEGQREATLVERIPGDGLGVRVNECAVDPAGRLLFGTITADKAEGTSVLWRLEPSGELRMLRDGLTISNGMGWTPDGATMFHVDSPTQHVFRMPYGDEGCGEPEVVATVEKEAGVPDGLSADTEGGFWVAANGGGQCRHFDASGAETDRIEVEGARQVSSCVLVAGPDGPRLYMTTGAGGLSEEELLQQPRAGFLFVADVATPPAPPPPYPG